MARVEEYAAYWNDEAEEHAKPYWIEHLDDRRLVDYLERTTNLRRCFEAALTYAEERFRAMQGVVVDLGAGVCWTTALVSRWPRVEKVYALDYSAHRLFKLASLVFGQLGAVRAKIERRCESIWPLSHPDESVDLVIFCQALYMHRRPRDVLEEVYRVLRPRGVVVISCESIEPPVRWSRSIRRGLGWLRRHSWRQWGRMIAGRLPDASGRYRYVDADYARFVSGAGLSLVRQRLTYPVFKESPQPAVNYFGLKPDRARKRA